MMILSILVGLGAAVLLLTAGYLFGIRRGGQARADLRDQNLAAAEELTRLRERDSQHRQEDESLRTTIQRILNPLIRQEQISFDLAHLESSPDQQRDLVALLDQIAEKGNYAAVLLSDEQGWTLAGSGGAADLDRLGATSSLLMLLADRLSRDGSPTPMSLMVSDSDNRVTLCRLFSVENQRLLLTVVGVTAQVTAAALDPALIKLGAALSRKKRPTAEE